MIDIVARIFVFILSTKSGERMSAHKMSEIGPHLGQNAAGLGTTHHGRNRVLFNGYVVVLTGLFFFAILSWYNFSLALINYVTYNNPTGVRHFRRRSKKNALVTFYFAVSITIAVVALYFLIRPRVKSRRQLGYQVPTHPPGAV